MSLVEDAQATGGPQVHQFQVERPVAVPEARGAVLVVKLAEMRAQPEVATVLVADELGNQCQVGGPMSAPLVVSVQVYAPGSGYRFQEDGDMWGIVHEQITVETHERIPAVKHTLSENLHVAVMVTRTLQC